MLVGKEDREIQSHKELEWRLRHTYSMDNIICDEDGQDFKSCTYSLRKAKTESALRLVLICDPIPGNYILH